VTRKRVGAWESATTRVLGIGVAPIPRTMPLQLSTSWVPGLVIRCSHARKESNLRSSVLETATPP